jgi:tRNA-Thr(GGU) m(6)t(6)A37 methyltransferase TsaA
MVETGIIRFVGKVEAAGETSIIRVRDECCPGLLGIEGYSHLFVLYWMHLRDDAGHRGTLQVTPPRHKGAPLTGVFACRSPSRPNPVGLTVVELKKVEGCVLEVSGLDALEGSPVVDIKPYSMGDTHPEARSPDWSRKSHGIRC